ncbi:TetR/AcrR family transcriptional regulator [Porphyromonas sp. COT-239 OH1446]|uniref:TetR/AcrR family transcriptional regulator n=1 Tax=Porphyromonas sp. COT-239 OH1446 TaxID=1515613 RepID=UPI00052CA615|nr:TetR/AcrR family transcriptional regulator [Porphyromonas sp. COT-239 OH1446]KGN68050.1 TetR family transcriptional regulator [Porphyromonas sp. COT-239 OH1446]
MQTTKEHIRMLLLKTAREAFLQKGFKAVSMREISKLSGVGLSNIYNYYPCKDDLLAVVLHPLLEAMNSMLENHNRPEGFSLEVFTSEDYLRASMREMMSIVTHYRREFKLLFLHAQDSRLEDYWEQWIEKSTAIGMEYMQKMRKLHPDLHTCISPFFMHFTCSWWINMLREIALHEELSSEEIECFIREYILFSTGGWEKLMNAECKGEKRMIGSETLS